MSGQNAGMGDEVGRIGTLRRGEDAGTFAWTAIALPGETRSVPEGQ